MDTKPSPIITMLVRQIEETKEHLKKIHEQLEDPQLFDKIANRNDEKRS